MLIDKGAKINALNEDGFSALDYAFNATAGNIKNSCNFNFNREQKKKRFDKAMEKKLMFIVSSLIQIYIVCCFFQGHEGVIRLLIQHGAEHGGR